MNPLLGIAYKVGSVLIFVIMASLIKYVSGHVPPGQAVFFRSAFAMPVIVAWLVWRHDLAHGLETKDPLSHLWRGLVGTTAMGLGFTALGLLALPEVTAIGYAAPIFTVVFAAMFLGEKVRAFRLGASLLGLVGVMVILAPQITTLQGDGVVTVAKLGAVLALMSAIFAALAQVFIRKLVATEKTAATVFYFSLTATTLSLLTIPFGWVWPTPWEAAALVTAGLLGGVGQILLTTAYRHGEAGLIAPFEYTSMLFALAIGYSVFAEVPTGSTIVGVLIVIAAGLIIIWRERQLGLQRGQARKVSTPQG